MVGAHGASGGHVALAHHQRGDEERIVVVLLVGREDEAVAHFAPGNGRIVADNSIVQAHPKLQVDVLAQNKTLGNAAILTFAAISHNSVGQNDTILDTGRGFGIGTNGHIMNGERVFDNAAVTYIAIAAFGGCEVAPGHLFEFCHH